MSSFAAAPLYTYKVVSLPLGDRSFFPPVSHLPTPITEGVALLGDDEDRSKRNKQQSYPPRDVVGRIMRRKQVSLNLMSPQEAEFFGHIEEEGLAEEVEEEELLPTLFFPLRFTPRLVGKIRPAPTEEEAEIEAGERKEAEHPPIIKATRFDKIKTLVLALIMVAFVGVCVGWKTHDSESHSLFGIVGLACHTYCPGDRNLRNFFIANEDHFHSGDVS